MVPGVGERATGRGSGWSWRAVACRGCTAFWRRRLLTRRGEAHSPLSAAWHSRAGWHPCAVDDYLRGIGFYVRLYQRASTDLGMEEAVA